jgi:hypothetical protein
VRRGEFRWAEVPEACVQEPGDAVVRPIASTTCDLDRAIIAGATPFVGPFAIGTSASQKWSTSVTAPQRCVPDICPRLVS